LIFYWLCNGAAGGQQEDNGRRGQKPLPFIAPTTVSASVLPLVFVSALHCRYLRVLSFATDRRF